MRMLTCGFLVLLTACAAAPTEPAAKAPTASPAATVAAAPAAQSANPASAAGATATAPVAASTAQVAAADAEQPAVAKAKPGYTLTKQNGAVVYCRRETPTGSRRPVQTCYTPDQLEAIEQATREAQDSMDRQRNSSGCGQFCRAGS